MYLSELLVVAMKKPLTKSVWSVDKGRVRKAKSVSNNNS